MVGQEFSFHSLPATVQMSAIMSESGPLGSPRRAEIGREGSRSGADPHHL